MNVLETLKLHFFLVLSPLPSFFAHTRNSQLAVSQIHGATTPVPHIPQLVFLELFGFLLHFIYVTLVDSCVLCLWMMLYKSTLLTLLQTICEEPIALLSH